MIRFFVVCLALAVPSFADAAYPYDSVCEILFDAGPDYNGGSASLIAVSDTEALLLTCRHVAESVGGTVEIHWAATGEMSTGRVVAVGKRQDIALCICPRPKGLYPIPITLPSLETSGKITNAGFPGLTGTLEWQTGNLTKTGDSTISYDCRPIPGMSGGVTFDQYGNQIGIIIQYWRGGGVSSSGPDMFSFIRGYLKTKEAVWLAGFHFEDPVKGHTPELKMHEYEDYGDFEQHVWELGPSTSPLIPWTFDKKVWETGERSIIVGLVPMSVVPGGHFPPVDLVKPFVPRKRRCNPQSPRRFRPLHRLRN